MRITTSCQWCNIQQLQERYFGIIANWLITWNTIPSNHLHRGMIFQSRDCCRFPSPLHSRSDWVDGREKWWNNVIRWLNWWHNKRLYKLITDCDVIFKLWHSLSPRFICYQHRENLFSPSTPNTMKTSVEHSPNSKPGGGEKNIFSTPFSHKIYIYFAAWGAREQQTE